MTPAEEANLGAAMAAYEFDKGHRKAHPQRIKPPQDPKQVEARRARVLGFWRAGLTGQQIASRTRVRAATIYDDIHALRGQGLIEATQRSAET